MFTLYRFFRFSLAFLRHGITIFIASKRYRGETRDLEIAKLQSRGAAAICRALHIEVTINGSYPRDTPMLIVSNHPGMLDPWIVATRFIGSFVAKIEMMRWPIFGPIGRACGIIFVDRNNRLRAGDFVSRLRGRMRNGVPIIAFPEGTTSGTDTVLKFKTGTFAAVEGMADAVVLPIYMWAVKVEGELSDAKSRFRIFWPRDVSMLTNARNVLAIRSLKIELLIGSPIKTRKRDRKKLAELAYEELQRLDKATREDYSNNRSWLSSDNDNKENEDAT